MSIEIKFAYKEKNKEGEAYDYTVQAEFWWDKKFVCAGSPVSLLFVNAYALALSSLSDVMNNDKVNLIISNPIRTL